MIKRILVRGERCTGTNYLFKLIEKNLNTITLCSDLGWKHSYINVFNKNLYIQDEYLTIFIFRNPVDWIGSMYYHLWHFDRKEYPTISSFIREEPKQIIQGLRELVEKYPMDTELYWERHPFTYDKPTNICDLRNWKNENFLSTPKILGNVMFITYEELYSNPQGIINQINDKYVHQKIGNFENVTDYKGIERKGQYFPKKYELISEEDFQFIKSNLNWELENAIGYTEENVNYYYDKSKK